MYKIKELIEAGKVDVNTLDADQQENINLIKTLSDNFTVENEMARDLDNLTDWKLTEISEQKETLAVDAVIEEVTPESMDITLEKSDVKISNNPQNLFFNDNYFKQNPHHVLGEQKQGKSRYSKEITEVIGTIENISFIEADYDVLAENKNATLTNIQTPIETVVESSDVKEFSKEVISESEKDIAKKVISKSKKKAKVTDDLPDKPSEYDLQSFEEVYNQYNPNISNEELKVFIWYKQYKGHPLSSNWYELADTSMAMLNIKMNVPKNWIKEGLVYYFEGDLLPAYLYLAENIYDKITRLVKTGVNSGQDADYIVNTYGKDVLDNQIKALKEVYERLYEKRLTIKGENAEDGLVLIPTSKTAKEFMINTLIDEIPFKTKVVTAQSNKDYGKPDFLYAGYIREHDKKEVGEMSLVNAFQYWLVNYKNEIEYKKGTNYADIIKYYINQAPMPRVPDGEDKKVWKAQFERDKARATAEGNRLFAIFLDKYLTLNDKIRLEMQWNRDYNGYVPIDYSKIPVALPIAKTFRNEPFDIKPEKREAVAFLFSEGSGCLAFDVGVGKSLSFVFTVEQFLEAGYCLRPMLVVPNQTYKQWFSEFKSAVPHRQLNDLYNLRGEYLEQLKDENGNIMMVDEGSVSIMTYEGFEMLGFNEHTEAQMISELYDILNQGGAEEQMSEKESASFFEKIKTIVGRGLKRTMINIEDLGFDFAGYDEAHAMKKVFTTVKGEASEEGTGKRERTQYKIQSGMPSTTALKGFMISQYILKNNNYRNIVLLTATPFTNSPLEIFSMLSLIAYHKLKETDLNNISNFFDNYIKVSMELTINAKLKPQYRQTIKGFNNLVSLQQLIRRFFNYKTGEDVGVVRPNKIVLPLSKKVVDDVVYRLSENEKIDTYIQMTPQQSDMMDKIKMYAEGKLEEKQLGSSYNLNIEDLNEDAIEDVDAEELDEGSLSQDEKAGVRILKSMNYGRNLALSPYLYEYSGMKNPTYKQYIENSPKLKYVLDCVNSVRKYHIARNEEVSGQVIYMDRGIQYFGLIKEYLVSEFGYKEHEVGIIYSQMKGGKNAKEEIKNKFLGFSFNEKTQNFDSIPDEQRIKVLIGSSTIKEGMNLQRKSTVLYNCFVDWNPTDFMQLCGRVWRQGNEFMNVRIVVPLVVDSIDVFMFQKLEEKTERINTIWSSDGKTNVLKLEDVNPSEIKYALIKDPKVLAELSLKEEKTKVEDDISGEKNNIKRLERIIDFKGTIEARTKDLVEEIKEIRPSKADKPVHLLIKEMQDIIKTQLDDDGKLMINSYERSRMTLADKAEKNISNKNVVYKPYWFDTLNAAVRNYEREKKDYLIPKNIKENDIKYFIEKIEEKIKYLEEEVKKFDSEEVINERAAMIIEDRKQNAVAFKTVPELVLEFERLNNLLSIKKPVSEIKKLETEIFCEIYDENGLRAIDNDSIKRMEDCISKLPQTKALHTDVNGEYTEERLKLHNEIINKFKVKIECIKETEQPIAILTGGSPASGKSTFLKEYANYLKDIYTIDADAIRAELPEYIKMGGWIASSTQDETKDIVNELLSENQIGRPCKYDLIYDGTMNKTKNYLPLIGSLKKMGYKVFIAYMNNISYQEILRRVRSRYQKSGRYVPTEVVDDFFKRGKAALNELKTKVDGYIVIDGSTKDYKIIEQGGLQLPKERSYSNITTNEGLKKESIENYTKIEKQEKAVSKKEFIKKKIRVFESLLKMTKDKNKKAFLQKKIRVFNTLAKGFKMACGGVVEYDNGGEIKVFSVDQKVEYKGEVYNVVKVDKLIHISKLTPDKWEETLTDDDISLFPKVAEKELIIK